MSLIFFPVAFFIQSSFNCLKAIVFCWGSVLSDPLICFSGCADIFFFSLFHQRADDEALTRFLQTSLFLVASPILVKSMFLSFRSSLTLSMQVFLCCPYRSSSVFESIIM